MRYKRDQGRYARMAAFWALFFLFAWGCLRPDGLVRTIRGWLHDTHAWMDPFPILGRLDMSMAISLTIVAMVGIALFTSLNRPRVADMLIETEGELRKVTWPTVADTWKGTLAVVVTVTFMLAYLTGADMVIRYFMTNMMRFTE